MKRMVPFAPHTGQSFQSISRISLILQSFEGYDNGVVVFDLDLQISKRPFDIMMIYILPKSRVIVGSHRFIELIGLKAKYVLSHRLGIGKLKSLRAPATAVRVTR